MSITIKDIGRWVSFSVVFVAMVYFLLQPLPSQVEQTRAAFTVRYTETSTDPMTGQSVQNQLQYWAIRSDDTTSFGSLDQRYGWREIANPNEKVQIRVSDPLRLKTTFDYSHIPNAREPQAILSDCRPEGLWPLGIEMIANFKAYHYQRISMLPGGGKNISDRWLAPELKCYEIKATGNRYNGKGILTGVFEKASTQITLGEPENALFAIPDDYVEVSPSVREKAMLLQNVKDRVGTDAAAGHAIPSSVQEYWIRLDQLYENLRSEQLP